MKKITKTIVALSVLAAVASCAKEISPVNSNSDNNGGIALSLTAGQEGVETRAAAGETVTDESGKKTTPVLWSENDAISVFDGNNTNCKLTLDAADAGKSAGEFSGMVSKTSDGYTALYPYQEGASYDGTKLSGVTLKSEQTATAGGFDPEAALMCAQSTTPDGALSFKNAVGYAKLTIGFECSRITLVGRNPGGVLAGTADITPGDTPTASVTSGSASQVSLIPASGSATIAAGTYYIALLPGTLTKGPKLIFTLSDGTQMYKASSNPLQITANNVMDLGTLNKADLNNFSCTDLSASESANCYYVQNSGDYKFRAVQGNSFKSGTKTGTSVGTVARVDVLWETYGTDDGINPGDIITDASYCTEGDVQYIRFSATSKQGNAVIAAKDESGTIIWSWHIWCAADNLKGQAYKNNAGSMMDRNLGAASATAGAAGSFGLFYQWGRKDPFRGPSETGLTAYTTNNSSWKNDYDNPIWDSSNTSIIQNATKNPMTMYCYDSPMPDDSWAESKTVNDPCPAGWRVPTGGSSGIWYVASNGYISVHSESTNGFDFTEVFASDYSDTIWYPVAGYLHYSFGCEDIMERDQLGYYWTVTEDGSDKAQVLELRPEMYRASLDESTDRINGCYVRCQKE